MTWGTRDDRSPTANSDEGRRTREFFRPSSERTERAIVPRPRSKRGVSADRLSFLILILTILAACGGGLEVRAPITIEPSVAAPVARQFFLGSDYPAGLVIPDLDSLRDTALIISADSPVGVIAVDLAGPTLALSTQFAGCLLPPGTGLPTGALAVQSATRLLLLTSTHLVDCNPATGEIRQALALTTEIALPAPYPLSAPFDLHADGTPDTITDRVTLTFPGGIAVAGGTVFVSFANYLQTVGNPVAAPGIVRAFDLLEAAPYLQERASAPIVTTGFNPTALRLQGDGRLLVVNSGVNAIQNGATMPVTESGVDLIDPATGARTWIGLGPVALSFQPPAVTPDGRAYFGSASFGALYGIDLHTNAVLHDHTDPLMVTSATAGSDFLTHVLYDAPQHRLWVASFTHSAVYAVDPETGAVGTAIPIGHAAGVSAANPSGGATGIGALALYPARSEILALTAFPGSLVATSATATPPTDTTNPPPPSGVDDDTPNPSPPAPSVGSAPKPPLPSEGNQPTNLPPPTAGNAMPPCTNPYATKVVSFTPGIGSGFGKPFFPGNVLGPPQGGTLYAPNQQPQDLLSLGCGGAIVLFMGCPITNGPGPDFLVFENAFLYAGTQVFAEPGRVGVSADGLIFKDFPCTPTAAGGYAGCAGAYPTLGNPANGVNPTDPALAGGNGFDLSVVGVQEARFVRIRDVSCTTGLGPNAGFELDAVSIVTK